MAELQFAINLAKEAGKIIKDNFILGMAKEWKEDNTPVTITDHKINKLVIDEVKKYWPAHSILAEEESQLDGDGEFVWVCDPIDGTIPFSHGVPTCVFSLALVKNGEPILGVVYDPFMDRLYFAEKGKGAYLNEKKIFVSKSAIIRNSVLGIPNWRDATYNLYELVKDLGINHRGLIINLASIIYMSVMVANGEFIAAVFPGDKAHDAAAVKIIVEEAGGKVTDIFGNEQRYDQDTNGFLASNGIVHDELLEIIKNTVKK